MSYSWIGDRNVERAISAINRAISLSQPSYQVKKISFKSWVGIKTIPQVLISTGKNALEYAYAVIENSAVNFKKIIVFQAKGYETVNPRHSSKLTLYLVNHPIPNFDNFKYSEQLISYFKSLKETHLIHFIITGGTSSCLSLSELEINYSDYINIIKSSINLGLTILQLNEIRSTIDQLKAGKLSILLKIHHLKTWILSDVYTNDAKFVGSGPTIPGIILTDKIKILLDSIVSELQMSIDLTKLQDKLSNVSKYQNPNHQASIISSNVDFSNILMNQLKKIFGSKLNYKLVSTVIQDDVLSFANIIYRYYLGLSEPTVSVWLGELTYELNQVIFEEGAGGRLSYFSFIISKLFKNLSNTVLISFATDGQDGTSPKSCYVVDGSTYSKLTRTDNYDKTIEKGNTGLLFDTVGNSFKIHQTNINLADVFILIKK